MTKKKEAVNFRDIAGRKETDKQVNINNNNDNNNDVDKFFTKRRQAKEAAPKVKGIYFEKEIARELDRIRNEYGKGSISEFVNLAVKQALKEQGRIEK